MSLRFPELPMLPLARYGALLGADRMQRVEARIGELRQRLRGRVVWNVSSTAVGGGVAEMVRSLLAYARGAGVDARWAVIDAPPEFFKITKRIHNAIHGSVGDGSPLGPSERQLFERVAAVNAAELAPMVRAHDVVIVHDPQPAGLVPALLARGAIVVWRCHIGQDQTNHETELAWTFLAPYIRYSNAYVFSRMAYVHGSMLDEQRAVIIPPVIDPFSAKNQPLDEVSVRAILTRARLIQSNAPEEACIFLREDGTPDRVDRTATVLREGEPPDEHTPLVCQVSRWDRLKDPSGVLEGFSRLEDIQAHLVLAGPSMVNDDPEGEAVLTAVMQQWRHLPPDVRCRVHIATIPTVDVDENAVIVNALQRHAKIIVQKSLQEGFGLTVTEAMWKARPVIATAVGGIQDQIDDGVQGILLRDPMDLAGFAAAIRRLLRNPVEAQHMGAAGQARVVERYLGLDSLLRYGNLIELLDEAREPLTLPYAIG
jgi:trehalose synthase